MVTWELSREWISGLVTGLAAGLIPIITLTVLFIIKDGKGQK